MVDSWQDRPDVGAEVQLSAELLSCNVMSLNSKSCSAYTAVQGFLDQCHDKRLATVAPQETRPHYMVVTHPAQAGCGGVLLGLHRRYFQ